MATASLPELDRFDRGLLVDRQGRLFKDYRRTLTPRYARVWSDIGIGYVGLGLVAWATVALDRHYPRLLPLTVIVGAGLFGYLIAYVQLFLHEAAHYLLAEGRKLNDWLANLFLGWMVGQAVRDYRVVHFDHHRLLGTIDDTEHSYFDAPNARFMFEALTGIKFVRVLLWRGKHLKELEITGSQKQPSGRGLLLVGLALNAAIVGGAAFAGCYSLALAWPLGMLVVHPAINAIRQLLEHRSFQALSSVDYAKEPHGANTRMFGSGPFSSTLGGAGFNRHLLHHWEPQLSYTRFAELEAFLLETPAGEIVRASKTTYARALVRLMRAP